MTSATPARPHFDARLTLHVLGGASIACLSNADPPPPPLGPGKPLALLVYLAVAPERSATREHLLDLLWSDVDPEKGRAALRQTLYEIKRRLGEGVITTSRDTLRLAAGIDSDREQFLAAVTAGDLERAVSIYRGEFLPSFAMPGGVEFERWADAERFQLRATFVRAAESLVRKWLATPRLREAQALARRVRDVDPLAESGWRLVLETLLAAGDSLRAGVEADRLEQMLADEGREPEPATRSVLRVARQGATESGERTASRSELTTELIGREREFASILAQWEAARTGSSRHVHISAPAGLGKSRLLADLHARLRVLRARVVMLRANPGERQIPFALAADLAGSLGALPGAAGVASPTAASLVDLNPSLGSHLTIPPRSPAPAEALRIRTAAISELIACVAEERPLIVLIDDLHWADSQSRHLLEGLLGRLRTAPVLVVTAGRPLAHGSLQLPHTTLLTLDPLSVPQISALLGSVASVPHEPWSRTLPVALHSATGGSPLLIRETLHLALEEGWLELGGETWSCPAPDELAHALGAGSALRRRVDGLSPLARRQLLSLAIAGTPLASTLMALATGESQSRTDQVLLGLEQRGFVQRDRDAWSPAHDEIAELTIDATDAAALQQTHGALGHALASVAADEQSLRLAAIHLSAADDVAALGRAFARLHRLLRRRGDRRAPNALAAELLGTDASPHRARRLVSCLPLYVRLGLDAPGRLAALTAAGLIGFGGAAAWVQWPEPPLPDAVVFAIPQGEDDAVRSAGLRYDAWENGSATIELSAARDDGLPRRFWSPSYLPVPRPGGGWAYVRVFPPDSGGNEVYFVDPEGRERRLTRAVRDDEYPSFSPDGRYVAYSSARWNRNYRYGIVVHDLATDSAWAVTRSRDSTGFDDPSDRQPKWSPDGTRIAFIRIRWDSNPNEVCWISVDGRDLNCRAFDAYQPAVILGWSNITTVFLTEDTGRRLGRLDIARDSFTVMEGADRWYGLSPDGRFALATTEHDQYGTIGTYVVDLANPSSRKRLTLNGDAGGFFPIFGSSPRSRDYLERLAIDERADPIPIGIGFKLTVRGFAASGRSVPVHAIRWHSADTSIATVDLVRGIVHPRRQGHVVVHATAGGWRSDSTTIRVGPSEYDVLADNPWDSSVVSWGRADTQGAWWRAFGTPFPELQPDTTGRWLLNVRGDGNYTSGVYSSRSFSGIRGLGLEALVSARVDRPQWQSIGFTVHGWIDEPDLAQWDHQTGSIPLKPGPLRNCGMSYPHGEGPGAGRELSTMAAVETVRIHTPSGMKEGAWTRIRLQLFPDGRCGLAINGEPVWLSTESIDVMQPFRFVVDGNAAYSPMLIGHTTAWSGVRQDIDWTSLDSLSESEDNH